MSKTNGGSSTVTGRRDDENDLNDEERLGLSRKGPATTSLPTGRIPQSGESAVTRQHRPATRGGMLNDRRHRRNGMVDDRGANLVEFAIIAPVLLIVLFGVMELARLGYAFSEVWTAAREGARYATTVGDSDSPSDGVPNFVDCDGIKAAALDKVFVEALTDTDVTVEYFSPAGAALADCQLGSDPTTTGNIDPGTEIRVTVAGSFDSVVPLIEPFFEGIVLDNMQTRTVNYGFIGD